MTYIHNVPGRVRIKSDVLKRNPDSVDKIRKALSTIMGIGTVDINLTTGSILINYNPKVTNCEEISVFLKRGGFFDSSRAITNDEYLKEKVSKVMETLLMAVAGALV
ncbi:MAG: HMA2 domain-containing protein [Dissulfurispiraceae bacterium]|jgi:copper chaperone CopZ